MSEAKPSVLLIEDDQQTRRFLKSSLSNKGWNIIESESGKSGLATVKRDCPDLVILDLGLPDMDGILAIKKLRQISDIPVLILSARHEEQNKIMALDAGADDYLTKPFSTGELRARLAALLRRTHRTHPGNEVFQTGQLSVDLSQRKIFLGHNEIRTTPIEFRLLAILVRHAGLVVTHRQLLSEVWGIEHIHDQHYLRIYMGQLRHKIEINPARPHYLLTEVGVGYRLAIHDNEF